MENRLLAIVGPTAAGKSALALRLAQRLGGEIVGADSRQVYRRMDIGTAKASVRDRAAVPHHLVDVVEPDEEYNLALFLRQAAVAVEDIHKRGKLPMLVGGTGQYIWAMLEGWQVPEVPPDPLLRARLLEKARTNGAGTLYQDLERLSPAAARRTDPGNVRRVIRALEICYAAPRLKGNTAARVPPPYRVMVLGLTLDRPTLYRRIDERVDTMLRAGWVAEVSRLLKMGYDPMLPSLSGVGYGELAGYLNDELSLEQATSRIKFRTHRFARRQYAWFGLGDPRIRWFDTLTGLDEAEAEVECWMARPDEERGVQRGKAPLEGV